MSIRNSDLVSGIMLVGLSGLIWWQTASFPQLENGYPGPSLFPRIIAICLALAGLLIAIKQSGKKTTSSLKKTGMKAGAGGFLRLAAGIGLTVAYPLMVQFTHFIPAMACVILFAGLMLKNTAWHSLFMAVLSAALIYGLFTQLLSVPL